MSKYLLAALAVLFLISDGLASVTVTAEADRTSLHVGEQLQVTVRAMRSDSPTEPVPAHAGLQLGPEWETGAQTAESEQADSTMKVKTWHFELRALAETTSTITPIIILADPPADAAPLATNRVLGPTISITILPPKVRPWWQQNLKIVALIAGLAAAAFTVLRVIRRKRQNRPHVPMTPIAEARDMMEEVHANCREDRSSRFFADVERVLSGYLSRRMGRPLGSATASEMAALAKKYVPDESILTDLQAILQRCTTARFSGARTEFRLLAETEELTRTTLERLDAVWVTDSPLAGTLADTDRI